MPLKDYESARGKVAAIQSSLNAAADTIRANQHLTESGRRTQLAQATLEAKKEAQALKTQFLAEREARRESLERRLFGLTAPTPTELMVLRDSRDRAASLTSADDAQLKLKLANQAGDSFMSKAIAQIAAEKGWNDVVEAYAETAPLGTRAALEQLADIPSGRMTNVADAAAFSIRAPRELQGNSDAVIEAAARGDTTAS